MRYLPLTDRERKEMLKQIGVPSIDSLFQPVPQQFLLKRALDLPHAHSESEIIQDLSKLADQNHFFPLERNFAGAGLYAHYVPSVVDQIAGRGEFLTAYTPYQPEISQGTLQAIYEFQTMMARILNVGFCNASHYDGSTATAEACLMALRINRSKKRVVGVGRIHPMTQKVIRTYFSHIPESITFVRDIKDLDPSFHETTAALLIQQPDFHGAVQDLSQITAWTQKHGALLISMVPNPTAFGLFEPPSGSDLITGEAASLGNSPQFGGPLLGFVAGKTDHARQAPGRLIGKTTDATGRTVYTITLATREQHIRREKATSNICTNEGLCLTRASIHLAMLGKNGFEKLSKLTHARAWEFRQRALKEGLKLTDDGSHYQEFCLQLPGDAEEIVLRGCNITPEHQSVCLGVPVSRFDPSPESEKLLLVCLNETHDGPALDRWCQAFRKSVST